VFVFAHVPKAAGTSVIDMIKRNCGHRLLHMPHHFWEGPISSERIGHYLERNQEVDVVAGHRFNFDLPWDHPDFDITAISFIREPVSRVLSQYYYTRKEGVVSATDRPDTLEEYVDLVVAGETAKSQFDFLSNAETLSLQQIQNLRQQGRILLCPVDRIDEGCLRLEHAHPEIFPDATVLALNRRNERPQPDAALQERLLTVLQPDVAMYAEAVASVNEYVAQLGEQTWGKLLRRFRSRQTVRKRFKAPIQGLIQRCERFVSRI